MCKAKHVPYFASATLSACKPFVPAAAWAAKRKRQGTWDEDGDGGSGGEAEGGRGAKGMRYFLTVPAARTRLLSKSFRRHDLWCVAAAMYFLQSAYLYVCAMKQHHG